MFFQVKSNRITLSILKAQAEQQQVILAAEAEKAKLIAEAEGKAKAAAEKKYNKAAAKLDAQIEKILKAKK